MSNDADNSGSQVIARAATLLRALETQPKGMTISQLSRETGLPRTTVHRLVTSLESQQLLIMGSGGVQLGPALARLAASAHTDVITLAKPAMETLGRRTRETVDLCVYRGSHAVSVGQFVSDQELRVVSAVGTAFPCHCTAHGKAILAELPDEKLRICSAASRMSERIILSEPSHPFWRTFGRPGSVVTPSIAKSTLGASAASAFTSISASTSFTPYPLRFRPCASRKV